MHFHQTVKVQPIASGRTQMHEVRRSDTNTRHKIAADGLYYMKVPL